MIRLLAAGILLVIFPWPLGLILWGNDPARSRNAGLVYASGLVALFALFELAALPMIAFARSHFDWLVFLYTSLVIFLAGLSAVIYRKQLKEMFLYAFRNIRQVSFTEILAFAVILFQIFYVVWMQHVDQDDAFFVATATTTLETNSMYLYDAYTGALYAALPSRYVLSPFPIWTAYISRLSGIHPAAVAHTLLPAFLIGAVYLFYAAFAEEIWPRRKDLKGFFLIFLSVILMFSGYSFRTTGMMMLLRIWQGKAILASLLIPMFLYVFYLDFRTATRKPHFLPLLVLSLASCMVSSMGIILGTVLMASEGLLLVLHRKDPMLLVPLFLCALPMLVCAAVYLFVL